MMLPPTACASRSAIADLPLAVGPVMTTTMDTPVISLLVTLVAENVLSTGDAAVASDVLRELGGEPEAFAWIDAGDALDLPVTGLAAAAARGSARAGKGIDAKCFVAALAWLVHTNGVHGDSNRRVHERGSLRRC